MGLVKEITEECQDCDGTGSVEVIDWRRTNRASEEPIYMDARCEACNGLGEVVLTCDGCGGEWDGHSCIGDERFCEECSAEPERSSEL